jgi:hypothetical protein
MLKRAEQKCANCDAALRYDAHQVYCRARPPTPVMIGAGQPVIAVGEAPIRPVIVSYFPQMLNDGWCREWRGKEAERD